MMWNPEQLKVVEALEKLSASPVSVAQVVTETGLPTGVVESEMASILHQTNGFFEVPSHRGEGGEFVDSTFVANVFDASSVRYVFPPRIRPLLERRQLLLRLQGYAQKAWGYTFAVIRISFGVVLLVSIVVIVIVALVISARSGSLGSGSRRSDGHHVIRFFRPRGYGRTDWGEFWWWYWWYNGNPFFWGYDRQAQQQFYADQERRRLMAQMDRMDEEDGAGAVVSRRRRGRDSAGMEGGGAAGRDGVGGDDGGASTEEMGFLEAVFSFLFGDGPPGPSEEERWQTVAAIIHKDDGVVLAEEVLPFLSETGKEGEVVNEEKGMLPVLTRFGGRPVPCTDGLLYDFPRLREVPPASPAGSDESSASSSSSFSSSQLPSSTYLYERPYIFSRASTHQLQMAGALGLVNVFGAVWLVDKARDLDGIVIAPLVDTALAGSRLILTYGCLYLLIPLARIVAIAWCNATIETRNSWRRKLVESYDRQLGDPKSRLSRRIMQASAYRATVVLK